jgi:diguanylate cyclase (GGDEF)-like protein
VSDALIDSTQLEALLALAARADEGELLAAATRAVVALLGDRGSAILLDGAPRVAFSTYAPQLDLPVDLERYPEIGAALDRGAVVRVDDVETDPLLAGAQLPRHLRAVTVLPLDDGRHTRGVLHVQATDRHPLPPHALATARVIAMLTASLLEAVRLRAHATTARTPVLDDADDDGRTQSQARLSADAVPIAIVERERTDKIGAPPRLLLVEDDPEQAETVAAVLELEGYEVILAETGEDGLYLARSQPPSLILLDVGLPTLDGYGVAEQLATDELTCDIPILFLSAAEDLMARIRQLRLGAVDFLAKPFAFDALLTRVERALREAEVRIRLKNASYLDELTGLNNLRFLQERMAVEQARCERYGLALSILMFDVDKLKQINDRHGHAVGSQVLAAIGQVLRAGTRETDIAVRYGGDEFVVILPHATMVEAVAFGERVLLQLRKVQLPPDVTASTSIGVATWVDGLSLDVVLEQADAAAYQSKRKGGGCVSVRQPDPAEASTDVRVAHEPASRGALL